MVSHYSIIYRRRLSFFLNCACLFPLARFRIKKKQRVLNMERSIADLEGRAEDLEKEAVELRRENGWLKEMVILKGRRALGLASEKPDNTRDGGRDDEEDGDGGDEAEAEDMEPPSRRPSPSNSPGPRDAGGSGGSSSTRQRRQRGNSGK